MILAANAVRIVPFVMPVAVSWARSPLVISAAIAMKSWRSFRNWQNHSGTGSTSAAAMSAAPRTERGAEPGVGAIGHTSTQTDTGWIINLIHQLCVSRCGTVSFPLHDTGEKRHSDEQQRGACVRLAGSPRRQDAAQRGPSNPPGADRELDAMPHGPSNDRLKL